MIDQPPKKVHRGDTVQFVDQLDKPIPEHWIEKLRTIAANIGADNLREIRRSKESLEHVPKGLITDARFKSLTEYTVNARRSRTERLMAVAGLAENWNNLSYEERHKLVKKYSRSWILHITVDPVPRQYPELPPHILHLDNDDYSLLAKLYDTLAPAVEMANFIRGQASWDYLPDSIIKRLLSRDLEKEHDDFFEAFMNNTLSEGNK